MLPSSGQISFGDVNTEVQWASNRSNTYLAGATGYPAYLAQSVNSLYGWMGQAFIITVVVSWDYNDGNYDLYTDSKSCEYLVQGVSPNAPYGVVDANLQAFQNITYWNGVYMDYYTGVKYGEIPSGFYDNTTLNTALCFNLGSCYVQGLGDDYITPTYTGSTAMTGLTPFYLGNFHSLTRYYEYKYSC